MRFKRIIAMMMALVLTMCAFSASAAYDMPYYIEVDITNQIVTIYNTDDHSIARQMLTSSGMNDCTPTGTFYLMEKGRLSERGEWTWFDQYQCWVKFATRIYRGYMFHSLPFAEKDENTMIQQMLDEFGMPTSHGCMRLRVDDARFIAKECLVGTRVKIYKDTEKKEDLRKLLHVSSYTGEDGMTYAEFLGYSDDALGSGASGMEVEDLQCRLSDLGYYGGAITGRYDTDTITAVKHVQKDLGLAQNGITTAELQEILYSDAAPVSEGQVSLEIGRSGPVVERLQRALQTLGCYAGEIHGIYDVGVADAIRMFQGACGYVVNGVADAMLQQHIYYQLEELEKTFGEGNIPTAELVKEEVTMATLDSENNILIRAKATTESNSLGKLVDGDLMLVNAVQGDWASITTNAVTGFVMKKYLDPFKQDNVVLSYTDDGNTVTIGHTMAEYASGAQRPADAFAAYYTSEQYKSAAEMVDFVTVNTGSDDVKLNLRSIPDGSGDVLAEVPNGVEMRVLDRADGYAQVSYEGQVGYLLDTYLNYWQGVDEAAAQADAEETAALLKEGVGETIQAVVVCGDKEDKVAVYELPSDDAKQLGKLPAGEQLTVLSVVGGWALVELDGHQAYMRDANLQFELL